ncbi:ImmA/IrrE family metallo-endopeptidase [Desulfosporosinus fructosivorans]
MNYESLLKELEKEGVEVIEYKFRSDSLKGLYFDNVITLNPANIIDDKEKACILAEEYGHYRTSFGNILDQQNTSNVKQEKRARNWAYEKLVPLEKLIDAFEACIHNRYDLADFLGVTENFLDLTLSHYQEKFGTYVECRDYQIYFSPLGVLRQFKNDDYTSESHTCE